MENEHITLAVYGTWRSEDVAYILALDWHSKADRDATLELTVLVQPKKAGQKSWPIKNEACFRVELVFSGVRNLRLSNFDSCPRQVMGFVIDDIKARGLEDICYSVEDYEAGVISFLCKTASIRSVQPKIRT